MNLPAEVLRDLEVAGIEVEAPAAEAIDQIDPAEAVEIPRPIIAWNQLTVRRRIWDWLLFRSLEKVRLKVLGPEDAPTRSISPAAKEKRLRETGREELIDQVRQRLDAMMNDARRELAPRLFDDYVTALEQQFERAIKEAREQAGDQIEALDQQLASLDRISEALSDLAEAGARAVNHARGLADDLPIDVDAPPAAAETPAAGEE